MTNLATVHQELTQKKFGLATFASDVVYRWLNPLEVHQKRKFVVFAVGRTGSTFLTRMLDRQKDIVCAGELFNPDAEPFLEGRFGAHIGRTKEYRDKYPKEYLWRFWTYESGDACLGFKMFLNQNPVVIKQLLLDRSVKKIILTRRNSVKRFVSRCLAMKTNIWIKSDNQPSSQMLVNIDPVILKQNVCYVDSLYEKVVRRLISSKQEFEEVYYEDLVGERKVECLTRVAEYIGCRDIDQSRWLEDVTQKQNSERLKEIVENYDELQAALAGTNLERFLD